MKDSFIQNERLVNTLNSNCELENLVRDLLEELHDQKENGLKEDYFDEEELVDTNRMVITNSKGTKVHTINEWLKRSVEQNKILLNDQTFYVMDISHHSSTPFNTIIFQSDLYPLKTKETTTDLMNRFIEHKGVPYEKVRLLGRLLGLHDEIPYVLGELIFIPEKDPLKESSSWFALHHVRHYEIIEQSIDMRLYFKNQATISIVTDRTHFLKQVEKGTALRCCQQLVANERLNGDYPVQDCFYSDENDLNDGSLFKQVDQSMLNRYAVDIQTQCTNFKMGIKKQLLTTLLGDDHPNLKEILFTFLHGTGD